MQLLFIATNCNREYILFETFIQVYLIRIGYTTLRTMCTMWVIPGAGGFDLIYGRYRPRR